MIPEPSVLLGANLPRLRALRLVDGLGLDVYQVHWCDRGNRRAPIDAPIPRTLDRPAWLGEFPTAGSSRPVSEILEAARAAGYSAALGWSAESGDRWTDIERLCNVESLIVHRPPDHAPRP